MPCGSENSFQMRMGLWAEHICQLPYKQENKKGGGICMGPYLAHICPASEDCPKRVQTVEEHCRKTAEYAAQTLEAVSLSACGYLAGLLHDAGKYTAAFQDYLKRSVAGEKLPRGSVNHTFAGPRFLFSRYHRMELGDFADTAAELLFLAAASHHGLFDCIGENKEDGFQHRLTKEGIGYKEAIDNFSWHCAKEEELDQIFQAARKELTLVLNRLLAMTDPKEENAEDETAFYAGLLARLLTSAVMEGDRRDTAEFMRLAQFPPVQNAKELQQLWGNSLARVEEKLGEVSMDSPISRARKEISDRCRKAADLPGGIYRLNVPTGSGKTLSSLRYALAHAEKHGKRRIIFTSPLLSILDQNAKEIRNYLQDDSLILEHHSNLIQTKEDPEQLDQRELLLETWNSPVIITTLVQLLNTLFSGKTSSIRRFHALCGSVIVIDEVQTVPSKMLTLFSLAVNFLTELCGATVVLCSATQPCVEETSHPIHGPIRELVPFDPVLWQVFRRTEILDKGELSLEEIAAFARELLETKDSLLIVCNKKAEAETIFTALKEGDFSLFQLSASMCMDHRKSTLEHLQNSLKNKTQKTVCVSTQVIEAGVHISFSCVIRLAAGMDSVIQTAGRCNRNGELKGALAPVHIVRCRNEKLTNLPDIQHGKDASLALLSEFSQCPEKYGGSLDSHQAIQYFYRALYRSFAEGHQDFKTAGYPSLFSLLSQNETYTDGVEEAFYFRQAFHLAGSLFQVFEENTRDVIVPYGKGAELIKDLCSARAQNDPNYLKKLLAQAKPFTVSLYQYQLQQLTKEGVLIPLPGNAFGLHGHYNDQTGFFMESSIFGFEEV